MPEQIDQAAQDAAAAEATAKAEQEAAVEEGASGEQTPEEIKAAEESAAAEADAAAKKLEDDNKEPDVKARKTAKDYIIERQQKKLAKIAEKKDDVTPPAAGESDEEENDIEEEDERVINKVLSKTLAPIFEKQIAQEDETELQQFIAENPDFKAYEAKARTFMKHPSRREVPIKSIFYEVAGDDLMKIGAARAKAANDEALKNSAGGGSGGEDDGEKVNVAAMNSDEFTAYKNSLREGMRK